MNRNVRMYSNRKRQNIFGTRVAHERNRTVDLTREHIDELHAEGASRREIQFLRNAFPVVLDFDCHKVAGSPGTYTDAPRSPSNERIFNAIGQKLVDDDAERRQAPCVEGKGFKILSDGDHLSVG